MSRSLHQSESIESLTAPLRDDVLNIFRAGAIAAAAFSLVLGITEIAVFGFTYPVSIATTMATGLLAGTFFVLSHFGHRTLASWLLIVGMWTIVMLDALGQAGVGTASVVLLPVIVLVAVWLTGSRRATWMLSIASVVTLMLIELANEYGVVVQRGAPSGYLSVLAIAFILGIGTWISLAVHHSYMARLQEQHELAETLAESEHEYRSIVENSVDPFYRADTAGRIVNMSPSIERYMGYRAEELIGQKLTDFYADPDQRDEFLRRLAENDGEVANFDTELIRRDGSHVLVSTHAHYWRDREGNVLGVEGIVRDITAWRELHERLARAGRIEVLDQLSGGLAHNFNNLLAIILGNAEMIRASSGDPAEVDRLADAIEQAASRGADLTSRMMAFTSQSASPDIVPVNVNALITEVRPMIDASLTPDITLDIHLADTVDSVDSPAGELEDAIINLVMNARDAIERHGTVRITTRNLVVDGSGGWNNPDFKRGQCVVIDVEDDGKGVPEELLGKVIEPFFTTKAQQSGTGLGLSTVYGYIRRIGGDIEIHSTEGQGTCVRLLLPSSTAPAPNRKETRAPALSSPGRQRVMVVEDEAPLRELTEKRLERLGYTAFSAASGIEARDVLAGDARVDLVLSDIIMPGGVSGLDLVDIVRELRPGTPIVLCTGYAESYADKAREASVRILRKPFNTDQMAEAIRQELEDVEAS